MDPITNFKMKDAETFAENVIPLLLTEEFIRGNPDVVKDVKSKFIKHAPRFEEFKHHLDANLTFNTLKRLENIESPTLILQGKKDRMISYKYALELAEKIPYSQLVLFEKSPHALFGGVPERVIPTLLEFLEE